MTEQVTDGQVLGSLMAVEEFQGYTVKPWTIKQLLLVMPILDSLVRGLTEKGVTLDNLGKILEAQGLAAVKDMVQVILPQLPEFLAVTLRIDRSEAEELDLALALQLGVKVLTMNLEHLKNAFGLVMGQIRAVTGPGTP